MRVSTRMPSGVRIHRPSLVTPRAPTYLPSDHLSWGVDCIVHCCLPRETARGGGEEGGGGWQLEDASGGVGVRGGAGARSCEGVRVCVCGGGPWRTLMCQSG